MTFRIGIDGGGTKTEGILIDATGADRRPRDRRRLQPQRRRSRRRPPRRHATAHHAPCPGCAPRSARSSRTLTFTQPAIAGGGARPPTRCAVSGRCSPPTTHIRCSSSPRMAGPVSCCTAAPGPSSPHAARTVRFTMPAALGWRFGDAGSGYDLGRRAIGRGLLELQGWAPPTPLGAAVREHTQLGDAVDAASVTKFFYQHTDPNRQIAGLAPAILRLAEEGDSVARDLVAGSVKEHLGTGAAGGGKTVSRRRPRHAARRAQRPDPDPPGRGRDLGGRNPDLSLVPVEGTPIEGVRRLLARAE
jgi:glucosamine kinase